MQHFIGEPYAYSQPLGDGELTQERFACASEIDVQPSSPGHAGTATKAVAQSGASTHTCEKCYTAPSDEAYQE
jgi:hypothetical protein